jgi:TonB family protein
LRADAPITGVIAFFEQIAHMQPKLQFSCPARWEDMRVGMTGRHCFQCDKEVVDFTRRTKADLVQYLLDNRDRSVCGRVRPDQIDVYHEFAEICIWRSLKTKRTSNLAFYLIAISGLSVTGCGTPEPNGELQLPTSGAQEVPEAPVDDRTQHPAPGAEEAPVVQDVTGFIDIPVAGGLTLDDTACGADHTYRFPEVMPEFPGGQDSLYTFMRQHICYPDWESDHNIEGKVYVEFVIDKDGTVSKPLIKRSVKGFKNFDSEVLRVVSMMPAWTPGRNGDDLISTKLVLPVVFTL